MLLNIPPIINGQNYAWTDLSIMLFGTTPLIGVKSINYDEEQDMDNNYGAGPFPIGQGLGNFKPTADIELYKEEIEPIIRLAPMNKIQLIPAFTIKVVYGNDSQALVIDTLTNCRFMNNPFSSKSGDKAMVGKFKLLIGNIIWG